MQLCKASATLEKSINVTHNTCRQKKKKTKTKRRTPYDPAILLLDTYPEKTIIQKDTHTPSFTAALFTIARTWKQPKFPSTEEWTRKMWYIHTMEYRSAIKREQSWVIC